jgi:hypothetical protein
MKYDQLLLKLGSASSLDTFHCLRWKLVSMAMKRQLRYLSRIEKKEKNKIDVHTVILVVVISSLDQDSNQGEDMLGIAPCIHQP